MALPDLLSVPVTVSGLLAARCVAYLVGIWLVYQVLLAAWRLSPMHPLSSIPGPRLAAATYLPEFYYDAILFGRYTRKIQKWHDQYGPIVRISPHELHCNDSGFIDEIYAVGGRKRDKPRQQVAGSAATTSGFGTFDHDRHRLRRAPLAKFFSRSMVLRLEPSISKQVQQLCNKLLAQRGRGPFDAATAYSCFTSDVISDYSFGQSFGFLEQKGWTPNFREPLYATLKTVFLFRFFELLKHVATIASPWTARYVSKDTALLFKTLQTDIPNQIRSCKADQDAGIKRERPTVFGSLLESDLPADEKTLRRLADEALAVLGAGTETTTWTLAVITYHLLSKPAILDRLTREIRGAVDDPLNLPAWATLEKLPYLSAVIQEGLRLSYGVSARTARVATQEDLVYRGEWTPQGCGASVRVEHVIPRGWAIGMSTAISHHDERTWPNSHAFLPERWLNEDASRKRDLDQCLLSFSKGSRSCIGMNLAYCELYLVLTAITLRVYPSMRLYETTEDDLGYDHDMFIPMPRAGSKGVRITIT